MKLSRKLTLMLMAGMGVVLGVNAWVRLEREFSLFETDVIRDHRVMGRGLRAAITEIWIQDGEARALDLLERTNVRESEVVIRWVWLDAAPGDPYAPSAPGSTTADLRVGNPTDWIHVDVEGNRVVTSYLAAEVPGSRRGALELSETLREESAYIRATLLQTLAITTGLFGVTALVVVTSGGILLGRPVRRLIGKARRVGAGDLSDPLTDLAGDELGELGREMNAMCERLQAANERVARETAARLHALDQLRKADRLMTVGQLAAGIAHELGTPLHVVFARGKEISNGEVEGEEARESARIVAEQAERMTRIIRRLLDFARPRPPCKVRVDLRTMAERTASLLTPLARKRGRIVVEPSAEPVFVQADPDQIQQVLTNLVVNAIQALPERLDSTGEVRVQVFVEGARGVVAVLDNGPGLAPEAMIHLFEPFFTTKSPGEGTGLGLPVAWGIVHEHGGEITVESKPGVGTRFYVRLTLDPTAPGEVG